MKILVLFAAIILLANCQKVELCPEYEKAFKCSSVPQEVCGIKTINGQQVKETFVNSCQACSLGKVEFTVEGKCDEYLEEAQFCSPTDFKIEECAEQDQPQCAWFNEEVKCLVYPCAINSKNRCSGCQVKNVLFTTEGKCPKSI
ncbi:kazal-type proteinase inhibitor 1 (macronuclear) [Tetrahymena thermophila SB210]|uniref:Kazal-type proteinase inhibitor 1 n=1 Tax=Tetrahymena thermophila (strain SB210) TaxID=312017 RepID=Q23UK1_TETTS|nr:kazal-type proteinase inhibitor 1 [Tetrahymena thermophila SB210]EAS00209.1 kazal-type proteinase inhibitor 1 [Tetrahymena thermophila SB210]|eukprot:XP_001020454.1 kazal-type proteinase inhibitor 1 [Tetrahymena thermophila SB210]